MSQEDIGVTGVTQDTVQAGMVGKLHYCGVEKNDRL